MLKKRQQPFLRHPAAKKQFVPYHNMGACARHNTVESDIQHFGIEETHGATGTEEHPVAHGANPANSFRILLVWRQIIACQCAVQIKKKRFLRHIKSHQAFRQCCAAAFIRPRLSISAGLPALL